MTVIIITSAICCTNFDAFNTQMTLLVERQERLLAYEKHHYHIDQWLIKIFAAPEANLEKGHQNSDVWVCSVWIWLDTSVNCSSVVLRVTVLSLCCRAIGEGHWPVGAAASGRADWLQRCTDVIGSRRPDTRSVPGRWCRSSSIAADWRWLVGYVGVRPNRSSSTAARNLWWRLTLSLHCRQCVELSSHRQLVHSGCMCN